MPATTFHRILALDELLAKKSFFLFVPRGTGKSYLIRKLLGDKAVVINLLKTSVQLRLIQILKEENLIPKYYIVSHDLVDRVTEGIHLLHWRTFVSRLWADQL